MFTLFFFVTSNESEILKMMFVDSSNVDSSLPLEVKRNLSAKSTNTLNPFIKSFLRGQESNTMLEADTNILDPLRSRGDDNFKLTLE